ncbi:MAG: CFI-box-CTERM domain-containing protein [Candidatus Bathyarchaeia archaeon]
MRLPKAFTLLLILVSVGILGAFPHGSFIPEVEAIEGVNVIISPASQTVDYTVNQYAWYSVVVQSVDGYLGQVTLTAMKVSGPGEISLSFPAGSTVTVSLNGQTFTYLMVTIGSPIDSPPGIYTIKVTATPTGSAVPSSSTTQLIVIEHDPTVGDFRLSSSPGTVIDVVPGGTGALQINVQGFKTSPGSITVSLLMASSMPGELSYNFDPFVVKVTGYGTNTSILSITTTALTPAGNYTLVVTGTAELISYGYSQRIHSWAVTVRVSGFYIVPSPPEKSVIVGKSTTLNIGVQSVGTFSSSVTLSASNVPAGMTATFNPASVLPPPGGRGSSILTISTAPTLAQGTYYLTIRGTSGSLTSSEYIKINVGNFTVTVAPSSRTAAQDSTTTFTVTGTSSDEYSATMTLTVSGLPAGVDYTFSPSSILIPAAGSASSTLTLSVGLTAPTGSYPVTITGTSGTQSQSVTVTLIIVAKPDFLLTVTPSSATVRNGSSTTFTLTVISINSFSSPVDLTVEIPTAAQATGSINPPSVTPPAGGSATATLTVTTYATAPAGSGTITVTGRSGGVIHTATATLTISPTAGRICIIATATYGSELAPEVYFLRLFRDRSVQTTFAGSQFMNVFNAWYYSFSPTVAEYIRSNILLRSVVKAVLYPLLGILHAAQWMYATLSFNPELAIVAAGIFASGLIGIVYFAPPILLALSLARRKLSRLPLKPFAYAWVACVLLLAISELSSAPVLMMFSTASLVLTTIAGSATYTAARAQRLLK